MREERKRKRRHCHSLQSGVALILSSVVGPDHLDSNPRSATNSIISSKLSDLSVLPFPHL